MKTEKEKVIATLAFITSAEFSAREAWMAMPDNLELWDRINAFREEAYKLKLELFSELHKT